MGTLSNQQKTSLYFHQSAISFDGIYISALLQYHNLIQSIHQCNCYTTKSYISRCVRSRKARLRCTVHPVASKRRRKSQNQSSDWKNKGLYGVCKGHKHNQIKVYLRLSKLCAHFVSKWSMKVNKCNSNGRMTSKHLKGQLDPPVSNVTFLDQRRSVGPPRE